MDENVRDTILETAAGLFAAKGLHGVSLDEIAAAAAVDRSLLAAGFADAETLYEAVLEVQFGLYAAAMQAALAGNRQPETKIQLFAQAFFDLHQKAPHFFLLFYRELLNPSSFFEAIVKKNIRRVAYLSDNNIARGIQKGTFTYEIHPANATMLLVGMFHYHFLAHRLIDTLLPTHGSSEEYFRQALQIFLNGITRRTGTKQSAGPVRNGTL